MNQKSLSDEEEIEVIKEHGTAIKNSIRKKIKSEPKAENINIPNSEPVEEAKIYGNVIEIPGLQSSKNDIKSPSGGGTGIKKKLQLEKDKRQLQIF